MTHKVCPVCGEEAIISGEFACCMNPSCMMFDDSDIAFLIDEWDAPRPLEESLRAEIESLRAELEAERKEIKLLKSRQGYYEERSNSCYTLSRQIKDKYINERNAIIASRAEARRERDAARAELEAYKARRCENCRWCMDYNDGPYCNNDEASTITYVSHDCCCWAWEAKEEVKE